MAHCSDTLLPFGGYADSISVKRETVAGIKFDSIFDLIKHGFNFVYMDADVYLNPKKDPLDGMLPLNSIDQPWDIQFQIDEILDGRETTNIGWMWLRPTLQANRFWQRCFSVWQETNAWDQGIVIEQYVFKISGLRF
jgi:hypothetical protein